MAVRKSTVYFFVFLFLAFWFGLIIYFSYDDKRLTTPFNPASLKRGGPAEFQLYAVLNARPDSPTPAPGTVHSLLVVLKNRNGSLAQPLLVPHDEFSCLRIQVRPAGGTKATYNRLAGDPLAGKNSDAQGDAALPLWHTLSLGPLQAVAKEVMLPKSVFPQPGAYEITLTWDSDDFERLEGHVAPVDRQSKVLKLEVKQTVTIAAPAAGPPPGTPTAPATPVAPVPTPAP